MEHGQLEIQRSGDVCVVCLLGEHDLATAPRLASCLASLVEEGLGVAVDVSATDFVDLAVIRALTEADDALRARGRRLALQFGTACPVRRLLELTEVETLFACAADRDGAIAVARAEVEGGRGE